MVQFVLDKSIRPNLDEPSLSCFHAVVPLKYKQSMVSTSHEPSRIWLVTNPWKSNRSHGMIMIQAYTIHMPWKLGFRFFSKVEKIVQDLCHIRTRYKLILLTLTDTRLFTTKYQVWMMFSHLAWLFYSYKL